MSTMRLLGLLLVAIVAIGCGGATPQTPNPATASEQPETATPTTRPTSTAPPALVGTWLGVHNCRTIIDALTDAGLADQALGSVVDNGLLPGIHDVADIPDESKPCAGAVDVPHSHFFTASGEFGSLDGEGNPVDDGRWTLIDATTLEINDAQFRFAISGDELRLEPLDVGACPDPAAWCVEAWKVMVAMPGTAWTRND